MQIISSLNKSISSLKALLKNQGLFFIALASILSTFSFNEGNKLSIIIILITIIGLFVRSKQDLIYFILFSILIALTGHELAALALPLFLIIKKYHSLGIKLLIAILTIKYTSLYIENISGYLINDWNLASIVYLYFPILIILLFIKRNTIKSIFLYFCINLLIIALIIYSYNWITIETFVLPEFRLFILAIPTLIFLLNQNEFQLEESLLSKRDIKLISGVFTLMIIILIIFPDKKYDRVIFDESHGAWSSVRIDKEKDKYGRDYFYSYSLLNQFLNKNNYKTEIISNEEELTLNENDLFIIKMPIKELGDKFIINVLNSVNNGSDVIVFADHTNLYNTTYHLNKLLANISIKISENAVFDKTGMPNKIENSKSTFLYGMIDSDIKSMTWLTGTSLEKFPLNLIPLSTYNTSFSEVGNYANQNRFGTFTPNKKYSYIEHISLAKLNYGFGSFYILLDSTPWSNFSLSKYEYKKYFQNLIKTLEKDNLINIQHYLIFILLIYLILIIILDTRKITLGALLIAIYFSVILFERIEIKKPLKAGEDYDLAIYSGDKINYEYLNQLIPVGEYNFTRITSALNRKGIDPLVLYNNEKIRLNKSEKILAINVRTDSLPSPNKIIKYIQNGGNLTLIFDKNRASDKSLKDYLMKLSIGIKVKSNLGHTESHKSQQDNLLSRSDNLEIKDIRWVTYELQNSFFKIEKTSNLVQTYKVRPIKFPYKNGYLNISFSADQFSDYITGDIWEGINTTNIAKSREKLLSSLIERKYQLLDTEKPYITNFQFTKLDKYKIYEDGKLLIEDKIKKNEIIKSFPSENIDNYIYNLKNQAINFINNKCVLNQAYLCDENMVSEDFIEWRITFKKNNNYINAIELIHDRKSYGLNYTYNILIYDK